MLGKIFGIGLSEYWSARGGSRQRAERRCSTALPRSLLRIVVAQERGAPPGWRWYSLEARPTVYPPDRANGVAIVRGAVCTAVFTRGPRKGQPNWKKLDRSTDCEIIITFADYDARVAAWRAGAKAP